MAESNDIFGTTAGVNTGSALEQVAAEHARRIEEGLGVLEQSAQVGLSGGTGTAYTAANTAIEFSYAVVPAEQLVTSHRLDMTPNPDYDQGLQGRDRERAASAAQVADIAANLNPERLGANPLVSEGAPVVGPDWQVESGNARTLALRYAQQNVPQSAAAYQDYLRANAADFGLDPEAVAGIENPVLVRVRQTGMDDASRLQFAAEANFGSVSQMSDTERAQRDAAALMQSDLLTHFTRGGTARGAGSYTDPSFLGRFSGLIPEAERPGFMQAGGEVSAAGVRQARNALLAAAYPDPALLSRMMEDTDPGRRGVGDALANAAGRLAALKQGALQGRNYDYDIGQDVAEAANLVNQFPQTINGARVTLPQHLLTGDMFGETSPITTELALFMDANKRSPARISGLLETFAGGVEALGDPAQGALFGDERPTLLEMWRNARARDADRNEDNPNDIFNVPDGPPVDPQAAAQQEASRRQAAEQLLARTRERRERERRDYQRRAGRAAAVADRPDVPGPAPGGDATSEGTLADDVEMGRAPVAPAATVAPTLTDDPAVGGYLADVETAWRASGVQPPFAPPVEEISREIGQRMEAQGRADTVRRGTFERYMAGRVSQYRQGYQQLAGVVQSDPDISAQIEAARERSERAREQAEAGRQQEDEVRQQEETARARAAFAPGTFPAPSGFTPLGEMEPYAPPQAGYGPNAWEYGQTDADAADREFVYQHLWGRRGVMREDDWGSRGYGRVDSGFGPPPGGGDDGGDAGGDGPPPDDPDSSDGPQGPGGGRRRAGFNSYREYTARVRHVRTTLEDEYARQGRAPDVGEDEFQADLNERLVSQNLINPAEEAGARPRWGLGRLAEEVRSPWMGVNVGYSLMTLGQGATNYFQQTQAGQYVTPEMQAADATRDLAPGVGSLVGMGLGMMTPLGAWGGQLIGQGLGSAIGGVAGAIGERDQSVRETADRIVASLGAASSSLDTFKAQVEGAGVPVQQLGAVIASVASTGPVGAGVVSGAAGMTAALGEYAAPNYASISRQLRDPALFTLGQEFRQTGRLSAEGYGELGLNAAIAGDPEALFQANLARQRSAAATDPQFRAAVGREEQARNADLGANRPFAAYARYLYDTGHPDAAAFVANDPDLVASFREQADRRRQLDSRPDPEVARNNRLFEEFGGIAAGRAVSEAGLSATQAAIQGVMLRGGGAAALAGQRGAVAGDVGRMLAGDAEAIATTSRELADPANRSDAGKLAQLLAQQRARQAQDSNILAEYDLNVFRTGQEERESAFSLSQTRGELSGLSAADLAHERETRARYLEDTADNPRNPLRPSERSALREQVVRLRYGAARDVREQREEEIGVGVAGAEAGVQIAQGGGTAAQIAQAQTQYAEQLTRLERQYNEELQRGNLTYEERLQKQRQAVTLAGQITDLQNSERQQYFAATEGNARDVITEATAGLPRRLRLSGTAGVDAGTLDRDFRAAEDVDRAHLAQAPVGSREWYQARGDVARDAAARQEMADQLNVWTPGAATQTQGIERGAALRHAESAFEQAQLAPWQAGPESNPLTRGLALSREIGRERGFVAGEAGQLSAFRTQRQREGRWTPLAEEDYQRQQAGFQEQEDTLDVQRARVEHDRQMAMFSALPETEIASPGRGVTVGVVGLAALSARYTPSQREGSWGTPWHTPGAPPVGTLPQAGAEAFMVNSGAAHQAAAQEQQAVMAAHSQASTAQNTQAILAELRRMNQGIDSLVRNTRGGPAGPSSSPVAALGQALARGFNPYRPSQ
ncbi:MAG: hypothetical protein JO250_12405 [Armatimonadetes bacterium]|nr:hypothetical protein [Armatimonadota bacterium]